MDEQAIGYDWKNDKRKPPAFEIIKLRFTRTAADEETGGPLMAFFGEELGMWNGSEYYIFSIYSGRWEKLEAYLPRMLADHHLRRSGIGIQYATIPPATEKYIPYHAIAYSRRGEVILNGEKR